MLLIDLLIISALVFFTLFIRSILKKDDWKFLLITFSGIFFSFFLFYVIVIPGSESSFEMGPIKFKTKTLSEAAKFIGDKKKTFDALNTDVNNTNSFIITASSGSIDVTPDMKFIEGKDYVTLIEESKDGRKRIFRATLPPGKEIKTTTPDQVTINITPLEFFSPGDESKAIKEYYNLGNTK